MRDPKYVRLHFKLRMPDGSLRALDGHAFIPEYSMREVELGGGDVGLHEVASAVLGYMSEIKVEHFQPFQYEVLSGRRIALAPMQPGDRVYFRDGAIPGETTRGVRFELCPRCHLDVLRVAGKRAIAKGEPFTVECPECHWTGDEDNRGVKP